MAKCKEIKQVIRFVKGDTHSVRFNYDKPELFVPKDGDCVFLTVKADPEDSDFVIQKSYPLNGIEFDVESKMFIATFQPEDTADLETGWEYGFDIEYRFAGEPDVVKTPLTDGTFILDNEYTSK